MKAFLHGLTLAQLTCIVTDAVAVENKTITIRALFTCFTALLVALPIWEDV